MSNLMSESLNKKIFFLTLLVLFFGYAFKTISNQTSPTPKVQGMQSGHVQDIAVSTLGENTKKTEITFMSIDEYESMLEERHWQEMYIDPDPNFDKKVENITRFMKKRNAPLADKARYIVIVANKYSIDYRLVPAISIIESSGGKKLYRPYNAWGWGGAQGFTFECWQDSIYTVTSGIANGYYARGATTPEQIAPAYNPHTPNEWARKVNLTMKQIGPPL